MTETEYLCEACGAPAVVHKSGVEEHAREMQHLCIACADMKGISTSRSGLWGRVHPRRTEVGAILSALGLFVLVLSLFADFLRFGSSEGFGWQQGSGLLLAVALLLLGALFRVLALQVIGLAVGVLTLLADLLAFGSNVGFGSQQTIGSLLGLVMIAFGWKAMRKKASSTLAEESVHEQPRG